ncbi:hypothetical protein [Kribbella sindirgiensis]|uniref:Uncharacterized protein n=1 Tax=Kribbella sindirgiensis TaxID=1124744 RepID=A0A4R0I6D6_9ACTN|nr:hypothetical protein [Kribbella sindirgiensis]TCC23284.1 hypothetical protein E0H50_34435 [Kribbella sindirgiensis]
MHELRTPAALATAAADDPMIIWAAQGFGPGGIGAAFGWMDTRTCTTQQTQASSSPHAQPEPQPRHSGGLMSGGGPAWLDSENTAAIKVYERLGYAYRRVAAASVRS